MKLSRRDWVLLPLASVVAALAIFVAAEIAGHTLFGEGGSGDRPCLILNDEKTGVRAVPHSVCREKIPESDWVEYRFNACGHRAGIECGAKPLGSYRIVLIGSSYAEGYSVPREKSFAALLPILLARSLGCKLELYNEAMQWGTAHAFDLRFDDVMAAHPDLIIWPVTPWDVHNAALTVVPQPPMAAPGNPLALGSRLRASKAVFLMRHFLYEDESLYLRSATSGNAEYGAAALMAVPTAEWKHRLQQFADYFGDMNRRARRKHVQLVMMALPGHAQADMIASGTWPASMNPYVFGSQLKMIAEQNNARYIDLLPLFRGIRDVHADFYPVNPHPNAAGHAAFATLMAKALAASGMVRVLPGSRSSLGFCKTTTPQAP